ncbi:hypothetical protein [Marinactinospora rubrisoli]|uniref:CDP-alcohol phosphatidyltransferase family protein n=1 Tax=Marinactinospora rubrisoli TaxID=2715399 RepID=A0ABW2KBW9_9ACTN
MASERDDVASVARERGQVTPVASEHGEVASGAGAPAPEATAVPETGVLAARALRPVSRPVARWAARSSVSLSALGRVALLLGVLAALWFTEGGPRGALVGSLLLGAVLLTDAVAAELDVRRTALDVWLAALLARLREYAVYAGLAVGGTAAGVPGVWPWAAGALVAHAMLDTVRAARAARPGPRDPAAGPAPMERRPPALIATVDPSRPAAEPPSAGDPGLLDELFGPPAAEPAPRRSDPHGRWEPRTRRAGRSGGVRAARRPGPRDGRPAPRPESADEPQPPHLAGRGAFARRRASRTAGPRLGPGAVLRDLAAFGTAERFAVIAGTLAVCNVRVTFLALIIGHAVALAAALSAPSDRATAR